MAHKFLVKKRLSLGFLGDGWQECYIDYTPISPTDLRSILETPSSDEKTPQAALSGLSQTKHRLKAAFVEGRGFTGDSVVGLSADDIDLLPLEVTNRLSSVVMGEVDPNSSTPSTN